jgi:hypothetical protein
MLATQNGACSSTNYGLLYFAKIGCKRSTNSSDVSQSFGLVVLFLTLFGCVELFPKPACRAQPVNLAAFASAATSEAKPSRNASSDSVPWVLTNWPFLYSWILYNIVSYFLSTPIRLLQSRGITFMAGVMTADLQSCLCHHSVAQAATPTVAAPANIYLIVLERCFIYLPV